MSQLKYMTDDINELDAAEHDLEQNGIPRSHIHVLSADDYALSEHDLPPFSDWAKRDILHYGIRGAMLGSGLASLILLAGFIYGASDALGWLVLSFFSLGILGFCTWEGGLMGVAKLNHKFERYREALARGEHLLVVDAENRDEERRARYSLDSHPPMKLVE